MARDPGDLYQISAETSDPDSEQVLLYYLDGFVDAGSAGRQLATHLLTTLEHTEVARFDVDSLIDYRSRRPVMTFAKDHWEDYEAPEISVSLLHDATGTPFLRQLAHEDAEELLRRVRRRKFAQSQSLLRAGAAGDDVVVILSGRVRLVAYGADQ